MKVEWRKGFNPEIVAAAIEKVTIRATDGTVSFKGFAFNDYAILVASMTRVPEEIPDYDIGGFVWAAIKSSAMSGTVTSASLLKALRKAVADFLRKDETPFALVSTLSLRSGDWERKISVGNVTLSIRPDVTSKTKSARIELFEDAKHLLGGPLPGGYSYVTARVKARSPNDAFHKGMRAINLIRGIWNLYTNRQTSRILAHSGKWSAINKVVLGPFHTVHLTNGALATQEWFYQPNFYVGPKPASNADLKKHRVFEGKVRRRLNRILYRPYLEDAIIRYSSALDNFDWNACFLELWGVLEMLTDTKGNYDQTIARASSIYQSGNYETQVLNHLRNARNSYAHQSESRGDILTLIYQLKQTVEFLIEFHLGYKRRFESPAEAMHFLELPRDHGIIAREMQLLRLAARYRR